MSFNAVCPSAGVLFTRIPHCINALQAQIRSIKLSLPQHISSAVRWHHFVPVMAQFAQDVATSYFINDII